MNSPKAKKLDKKEARSLIFRGFMYWEKLSIKKEAMCNELIIPTFFFIK